MSQKLPLDIMASISARRFFFPSMSKIASEFFHSFLKGIDFTPEFE
jgi:hypothetical protein